MYYVYYEFLATGKQTFIKAFDTAKGAIEHIKKCYGIDTTMGQLGEYYYFMRKR